MTALPTRSCASSCRRWRTFPFPERPDIVGRVERSATRQSPALFSAGCLRLSPEFTRPTTSRRRPPLDAVGAQRRKAVEPDRGVARRVGAGRQDLDLVADLKPERQLIFGLLVQDIGTVAGRPGEDHRPRRPAPPRGLDAEFDPLADCLGEAVELAAIELDPPLAAFALVADQPALPLDRPAIATHQPP